MTTSRLPARRSTAVLLALALAGGGVVALSQTATAAPVGGTLFYGLTPGNGLVSFRSGGTVSAAVPITGLDSGDVLVGIDVRPTTGALIGVGKGPATGDDSIYVIDPATAVATKSGASLTTDLDGTSFGVDVNPVVDRLRIVSDSNQNLRVNMDTGAVTVDTPLQPAFLVGDPGVTGAAYTSSRAGATTTTLFDLDTERNRLYVQDPPNDGDLNPTATLASPAPAGGSGFDIDGLDNTGYATLDVNGQIGLYSVALPTSASLLAPPAATRIGTFALPGVSDLAVATPRIGFTGTEVSVPESAPSAVVTVNRVGDTSEAATVEFTVSPGATDPASQGTDYGLAAGTATFAAGSATATITIPIVQDRVVEADETLVVTLSNPSPNAVLLASTTRTVTITNDDAGVLLFGLTATGQLATIETGSGVVGSPVTITGLAAGESVVGIDTRPANGDVLAVIDGPSADRIATLEPTTGALTAVAPLSTQLSGTSFGVDVNPVVDRLRIVSDTGQNLRVDPTTGAATVDGTLNRAGVPATGVGGAGYTNNLRTALATQLYDIDTTADALLLQNPPNDGTVTQVAPLGVDASGPVGFDVSALDDDGYATLTVGGTTGLYDIRLSQTVLTSPAATRIGSYALPGVTDLTVATPRFSVVSSTAAEGTLATVTVRRTGDLRATATVDYTTEDAQAVNGVDYIGAAGTLTFGPGESTRTFTFPVALDTTLETDEGVGVVLSNPSANTVLAASLGSVTITDVQASTISVPAGPVVVSEATAAVDITVTRSNPASPATVQFATGNGGARAGEDYVATNGTLSFAAGEASKVVQVALLDDDAPEPNESFTFTLSNPSNGAVLGNARLVITTTSDDAKSPTTITSRSSALVRYPAPVTVAGVLRGVGGVPLGGRTVFVLYAPLDNSAPVRVVASVRTQDNGLFSTAIRPTQHGQFAAVYNGSAAEGASASDTTVSLVQYTNPTIAGPSEVRAGTTVAFRGSVQPGALRPRVKLQLINRDGRITDLTSQATTSSTGAYSLSRPFRVRGTFRVRVLAVSSSKNLASASRTFTITVR